MSTDNEAMIRHILDWVSGIGYIKPEDIPNIDLYMDQVTTFMEEQLAHSKRYQEDKILTKTMINNYAKNNLLPSPVKKRYSKEHLLVLIFIYYFKNILSINDIQTLLNPITDKYFKSQEKLDLTSIYEEVFSMEKEQIEVLKKELLKNYQTAQNTFTDAPEDEQSLPLRFLRYFGPIRPFLRSSASRNSAPYITKDIVMHTAQAPISTLAVEYGSLTPAVKIITTT